MTDEPTVFLVDDDPAVLRSMTAVVKVVFPRVEAYPSAAEFLAAHQPDRPGCLVLDVAMPSMSGLELHRKLIEQKSDLPVVFVSGHGNVQMAVEAMQAGATDYLTKPIDLDLLMERLDRVLERTALVAEVESLRERLAEKVHVENIVGESGAMQEVLSLVHRVAASDATVLIRGESGTGKELIGQAIHAQSPRADGPFIKVNIAALPETLLESELFGHEKGAFTGAEARRVGRFEAAHGGSIFLDEIGDLTPALQVKLLRVLQERVIERLGSQEPIAIDVRVITATHRDLESLLADGRFREDLYYRLNVFPIVIPPLRDRREDIPLLVDHVLEKVAAASGKKVRGVSKEVLERLLRYDCPGNVRELENIIERAVLLARHDLIYVEDLPPQLHAPPEEHPPDRPPTEATLPSVLESVERQMIARALERHGSVQTRAAEELGISERVLRYKLKKYGLA
ncbi:MAG: sigma-54-dependent transcriptional regulator [Candidatus Tectimicrobiota bacterium]